MCFARPHIMIRTLCPRHLTQLETVPAQVATLHAVLSKVAVHEGEGESPMSYLSRDAGDKGVLVRLGALPKTV